MHQMIYPHKLFVVADISLFECRVSQIWRFRFKFRKIINKIENERINHKFVLIKYL